jgi:hypothetical protein
MMSSTNSPGPPKDVQHQIQSSDLTSMRAGELLSVLANVWLEVKETLVKMRAEVQHDYNMELEACHTYREFEKTVRPETGEYLAGCLSEAFKDLLFKYDEADGVLKPPPVPTLLDAMERTAFFEIMGELKRRVKE